MRAPGAAPVGKDDAKRGEMRTAVEAAPPALGGGDARDGVVPAACLALLTQAVALLAVQC